MKKVLTALALAASTLALAPTAGAEDIYRATANGQAEQPPNNSPGSAIATFEVDGMTLRVDMPFRDLLGPTMGAHVHCCTTEAFTGVAPVAMPFVDFPLQVTTGDYRYTFDLSDPAVYDPFFLQTFGGTPSGAAAGLMAAIEANQAYVNIHTDRFPNGEIRGFTVAAPIPEPATWGMLGVGLVGLAVLSRRRPSLVK